MPRFIARTAKRLGRAPDVHGAQTSRKTSPQRSGMLCTDVTFACLTFEIRAARLGQS
jgi:hypothetical protein